MSCPDPNSRPALRTAAPALRARLRHVVDRLLEERDERGDWRATAEFDAATTTAMLTSALGMLSRQ